MAQKPTEIETPTVHVKWDRKVPFRCPTCNRKLVHLYNDGGRKVDTMQGALWVVTNLYKCPNHDCEFNKAFSPIQASALKRKQFGLDVWAKVIQHHFKHHLDYTTISEIMWDDWEVSISPGTIQAVCESFEVAAKPRIEEETKEVVQEQERIVVRLDGVQPEKGRPALWLFYDNISGKLLDTKEYETADSDHLVEEFNKIEKDYEVKITGGVSDKQPNIVLAFKQFRPDIPHSYCQYHFLDHVVGFIASKDSHLLTQLRSDVRNLSLVSGYVADQVKPVGKKSPVEDVFAPIIEELICAISTTGDFFKIFPGIEAYTNMEHVLSCISPLVATDMPARVKRSLTVLVEGIETILETYRPLQQEIGSMILDFDQIRCILGHRTWSGDRVKKSVDKWVYMLQCRLKRRGLTHDPSRLKSITATPMTKLTEAWQEWVRLVHSYEGGLYLAYDNPDLAFTNNDTEADIHRLKFQFKKWLGRSGIQDTFEVHGGNYANLLDFDFTAEHISNVLLASEIGYVNEARREMHAHYATTKRTWRIREQDTGNIHAFKENLDTLLR